MKKSAVIVLILSILFLVFGAGLVIYGVSAGAPHSYVYHSGAGFISYAARYTVSSPAAGTGYISIGHLFFDAGLVLMVIFVILTHYEKKDGELKKRERRASEAEARKAKAEAVDVTVHEEGEGEKPETHNV